MFYEPADADLPSEHDWSTEKYLDHAPRLFQRVRDAVGWDSHLLHDVHHRLTLIEAARLGKSLEPYCLFWMVAATHDEIQERSKEGRVGQERVSTCTSRRTQYHQKKNYTHHRAQRYITNIN